jgi:hypothetical protein
MSVTWNTNRSYTINTLYQGNPPFGSSTPNDDAFFNDNGSGLSIVFHVPGEDYVLRRQCANPVGNGSIGSLPDPQNFNMSGRTTVSDSTVLPGQQITFRHFLRNSGPTRTNPTTINWATRNTISGQRVDDGNAGTFGNDQEKSIGAATENVRVPADAAPGSQICRRIEWSPDTENGGSGDGPTVCATVQYNFELEPRINVVIRDIDGQDVSADGVAEDGYTVEFQYSVHNGGLTESRDVNCEYREATHSGYNTGAPANTFVPPGANCAPSRTFPRNNTTIAIETVPAPDVNANTTICRSLTINPATHDGGTESVQACVPVVAKPYERAYGGDVRVGGGFESAPGVCAANDEAAIVGWSRRAPGSYGGAGVQYAAYALDAILDFASALGTVPGGSRAPAPNGLSFANIGLGNNTSEGHFGGFLGSAPCIPDYYADRPESGATVLGSQVNLSSLGSGTYVRDGSLTFSNSGTANINPGETIVMYVDGDVFIRSDIVYPGAWNVASMPLFQLVVRGNIYIENDVTRLDGIYIAQPDGASGGVIYTCATGMSALPLDGNLFDTCNNKLTVNGAFVADQVQLLRTSGSLSQSNRGDGPPGGGAAGEVFNFNPTNWINQPPDTSGEAGDYDAIISLPPIL